MAKVFVTDGALKHTLAITRSLSKLHLVDCGESTTFAESFFSDSIRNRFLYPDPHILARDFLRTIEILNEREHYDAILPVSYESCVSLASHTSKFTNVMLPTQDAMKVAADKQSSQILAEKLGIPTPTTKVVHTLEDLENASQLFGHPFIIKDVFGSGKNQVISRHEDIYACGKTLMQGSSGTLIAQEFVIGDGYGFFALMKHGKLRAYFMHKRLREGLPYGGPSTCARSWFDEKLAEYGIRILEALDWNGVAMVEFRKSKSGEFKLLEINPKFWGSLDLALASGVDFPKLVVNCIVDGDCETVLKYNLNMTYQWPVPDDILRMKWNLSNLRTSVNDIFDPSIKKNILMSDPGPLLISAIRLAKELILGS